jgi:GT2 family glycosyltransferase
LKHLANNKNCQTSPLVSVVILNYNGEKYLKRCLNSVFSAEYPNFEVIIVDNASTDSSLALILALPKDKSSLAVIRNSRNLGFAEGNNIGIAATKGKYVVLLNNDTEVTPDWLNMLVCELERDSSIGAAQSKLLQIGNKTLIDSLGDFIDYFGVTFQRGYGDCDDTQNKSIIEIFSARGAAMIIRKSVIKQIGVLDSLFFLRCEDIDLSWRIRLKGYRIILVPSSVVYHAGSYATSEIQSSEVLFHSAKNQFMMLFKNYELHNFIKFNPLFQFLGNIFFDIFIRKRPLDIIVRFRVLGWILLNFKQIYTNRQRVQNTLRKVPDSQIMRFMSKANHSDYFRMLLRLLSK